jgi:hypothetical protein
METSLEPAKFFKKWHTEIGKHVANKLRFNLLFAKLEKMCKSPLEELDFLVNQELFGKIRLLCFAKFFFCKWERKPAKQGCVLCAGRVHKGTVA